MILVMPDSVMRLVHLAVFFELSGFDNTLLYKNKLEDKA